jgi:dynein heavy chain
LKRSFAEISDAWLDDCKKEEIYRKMVFGVSFFHAIVQERRKFGPLGWNVKYEFNDSDLHTSYTMLKIFLDEQEDVPWEALVYVTGIINYGGRVTDDMDRRCLITTLEKYYCPDNLGDDYFYSESELYKAPPRGEAQSYRDYIDGLPEEDAPEVFGLHDNANIAYQRQESDTMVEKVLSIQPRIGGGAGGGLTPDEIVLEKCKTFNERIPPNLDRAEGLKDLFKTQNGLLPSLTTVLLQEMEKFNRLLRVMRRSLDDLVQAIGGFIVMSSELDAMYLSLMNGTVPANWEKVAYPSLKPLTNWFDDLLIRVEFINNWLTQGNPIAYWISGLFFPQGFLTGCLQTHSRLYKIAIDELNFSFEVLEAEEPENCEERPQDGVFVYGLFMDGAIYNREQKCIDEQIPDELYDKMPVIHFKPTKDYVPNEAEYSCPMYKTGLRRGVLSTTGASTNYVLNVELPCS